MAVSKVRAGDALEISAEAFNSFVDAADAMKRNGQGQAGGQTPGVGPQLAVMRIKNNSGADVDRFAVLGIDTPAITPAENEEQFTNQTALVGSTPAAGHAGKFAICLEPIVNGEIGRAAVAGVCVVKIDVLDATLHGFADVKPGYTAHLQSAATGPATILWKEAGTGEKWAIIRFLSDGMPAGTATNQLARWNDATKNWVLVDAPTAFGQRLTCTDDGTGGKVLTWQDAQALAEIFTDDFNQKDGPLEKRWFNWNANAATVLDNSIRLAGWCEYIVNKCGYDAELALDGSYTHRMCFNNYYVPGGKNGADDFYLYCRVNKVGAGNYPRGVQLRMHLDSGTSTATCYLELCNDGPIKTIQQANVPWPTGWFNLRLEVRGNSFQGYVNDTLRVSGVTRYGSGEADPVVPPDDGTEDWYTVYTGKFLGWGVVPGAAGQVEAADDYALFIYR